MSKKKLLLHSCCAPCSTIVIEELRNLYDLTILFYNSNIEPLEEYIKRKNEQIRYIEEIKNISFLDCDYDNSVFTKLTEDLRYEKEGGKRCNICFQLRLEYCSLLAKEKGFDLFGTTLSVSPHKNSTLINQIGESIQEEKNIEYLIADFKKKDGYKKSILISNKYTLYRQNYSGCLSSLKDFL